MDTGIRFNVCLMRPGGYIHSLALLEAAEYINAKMCDLGYESQLQFNKIISSGVNIIFGGHLVAEKILNLEESLVIFNTEQLSENSSTWVTPIYKALLKKHPVWDYSKANADALGRDDIPIITFANCENLKRIPKQDEKSIDLFFYGSINERRKNLLTEIQSRGLRVQTAFGMYGKERDLAMSRSSAILNLNFYDSSVYPQIRAFYPLINEIPVISESWAPGSAPKIHENAVFTEAGPCFVDYIESLLSNGKEFNEQARRKILDFKKSHDDSLPLALSGLEQLVTKFKYIGTSKQYKPVRMNLGSGKDYKQGYLNVDVNPKVNPDILLDLSDRTLFFPLVREIDGQELLISENQFSEILANDVLEHVPDLTVLMSNCLAILKCDGVMKIKVPYDLSYGAWQDPTHIRAFNERSWLYYTDWFWYLGWSRHRFTIDNHEFKLSEFGLQLLKKGVEPDVLSRTPRAIDEISVTLRKIELTENDKMVLKSRSNVMGDM